ncbi:putative disease resistance RPP13-like protein 1 [Corylus avellana]|uniref:putative disease resistance RPP13-like protein 1 n=1 Tax=Corylus avellana TaxID=13451 RepID=UPI00286BCB30|nr:putative disease resistance RPP13-like protein 1 [Corylus avellana]
MTEFFLSKVGEFALTKLFESLYDRLAVPKFWDFIGGEEKGIQANLDKWRQKLQDIQNMLDDAEEKQYSDTAVKQWLDDLKHLVYDVDDIVDELATKASTAAENQARPSKLRKLNIVGASSSTHKIDSTLLSKITKLTDRFNGIVTQKDKLNLKETADGRDKDKKAILELLVGEKYCSDAQVSVIPILGMGGIGKTTLAQLVYNDEAVQNSFDLKAWACVSQDFNHVRVTKAILKSVICAGRGDTDLNLLQPLNGMNDDNDLGLLQETLQKKLQGKKFLVVLDDLWNDDDNDWSTLRAPFLVGAPGSKIVITTRIERVSSTVTIIQPYRLEVLSNDDCFSVFAQNALGASNFNEHPDLQDIGEKIVERCKGLPLAARTLGGLLRTKKKERNEWKAVLKSKIWDIPKARSGIVPALMLSYHHLPSHLKRCFMYCSILPEDYEFEEQQLVLLWMAECLIQQPEGDKQMEDLGSEYFKDLLSRSFFQQSSTNRFQYEKPRFVMHDLINNLAQRVAGDICFRMEDKIRGGNPEKVRHSSYLIGHVDIAKMFEPFFEFKFLRTFLPLSHLRNGDWTHNFLARYLTRNVSHELLVKLPCLRALSLSGYCIVELPDSIGDLKYLRYLDLSYTKIRGCSSFNQKKADTLHYLTG